MSRERVPFGDRPWSLPVSLELGEYQQTISDLEESLEIIGSRLLFQSPPKKVGLREAESLGVKVTGLGVAGGAGGPVPALHTLPTELPCLFSTLWIGF